MMRRSAILAASLVLLLRAIGSAQTEAPAVAYPYPVGGGWGDWGRASTVQEGAARGAADMIRAAGENNLLNSQAAQNYEAARSQNLDNRVKYAETYYAKRRMNEEYRAAKKEPPPTAEQLFRRSEAAKPKRLSPGEFDPVSGRITWPLLLQGDAFTADRATIEQLFGDMATNERLTLDQYQQIRETGERMQEQLNSMIREVAPRDHMKATTFLTSLLYEARLVAG
jgi:hypothetical protein